MKTWEFLLMILIFVGIGQITNHYFFDSENYPDNFHYQKNND